MPELTAIHFGLFVLMLVVGAGLGWIMRTDRCAKEKIAVSAGWQNQLESQQSEHNRLAEQNKSLMEQISQYQASQKDYSNRAKELSASLKEAFARRDDLQRQIKDVRGNLDVAVAQRDRLQNQHKRNQSAAMKEKDDKIFRLSRELTSWQSRVPPLVEKFQERNKQAFELEEELEKVTTRLQAMEDMVRSDQTRIEPVDAESLPDGGDASNEPIAVTSFNDASTLQDQIDDDAELADMFEDKNEAPAHHDTSLDDGAFAAVFSDSEDSMAEVRQSDSENGYDKEHEETHFGNPVTLEQASTEPDDNENGYDTEHEEEHVNNPVVSEPAAPEAAAEDDLQMIKGIGPSIEKTLHSLGIVRFHQIAEMSEYDIDRVAQQLRGFRSRIYREDWIGQARDLQYQKNNNR
ncbi:MAG: hypothetical protein ACR2Q3_08810 [Woeseiaceae bacterium]